MRADVQEIFRKCPHEKQVMMFSATLSKEIRPVCKKFMQDVSAHCPARPSVSLLACAPSSFGRTLLGLGPVLTAPAAA